MRRGCSFAEARLALEFARRLKSLVARVHPSWWWPMRQPQGAAALDWSAHQQWLAVDWPSRTVLEQRSNALALLGPIPLRRFMTTLALLPQRGALRRLVHQAEQKRLQTLIGARAWSALCRLPAGPNKELAYELLDTDQLIHRGWANLCQHTPPLEAACARLIQLEWPKHTPDSLPSSRSEHDLGIDWLIDQSWSLFSGEIPLWWFGFVHRNQRLVSKEV